MKKIIQFETTQFDLDFVHHIKKLRENSFTKEGLSLKMGVAKSFVGNVESYSQRHKYSTRHLALLAKAFGYKNISELMNFPTPKYDKITVTVEKTLNDTGTKVLKEEIIKIEPIK